MHFYIVTGTISGWGGPSKVDRVRLEQTGAIQKSEYKIILSSV
jgi:hypothetical protein